MNETKRGRARGVTAMALGSASSGVLAYVFFAAVTRAVGAEDAAGVSVLWTYWSFAAAALTFPVQHWIVRVVSAAHGREGGVRKTMPSLWLVVGGLTLVTAFAAWVLRDPLFHHGGISYPALVGLVTAGSAFVAVVRGLLTARGRLQAVAATLVAENGLRCVLAGVLIAFGADDARLFGLALALGQLVGFCWPAALRPGRAGEPEPWLRFVAGAAGGQLISQLVLTGGPVVLALAGGGPAEVTSLFVGLALFRLPYTLATGAVPPLTGTFTRMLVAGRHRELSRLLALLMAGIVVLVVAAALVGHLIGPWSLQLVFGSSVELDAHVCAMIAAGSVLAVGTLVVSLMTMAGARSGTLARVWLVGAAAAGVALYIGVGRPVETVAVAFLVAEAVAFLQLSIDQALFLRRVGKNSMTS